MYFFHDMTVAGTGWGRGPGRWATLAAVRIMRLLGAMLYSGPRSPRVLLVKADGIGDFVQASPLIQMLSARHGERRVDLVTSPAAMPLAQACPLLGEVWTIPAAPRTGRGLVRHLRHLGRLACFAMKELAPRRYREVVVGRWDESEHGEAILAAMTGAPEVRGFSEKCAGREPRDLVEPSRLLTTAIVTRELEPEWKLLAKLAASSPSPTAVEVPQVRSWWSRGDAAHAQGIVHELDPGARIVAVAPGAGLPRKRWPAEKYAEVVQTLSERDGVSCILLGTAEDDGVMTHLDELAHAKVRDLTGQLTLPQCAALLAHCSLFIGNDSGLKHLATAVGVPCVEISSLAEGDSPEQIGTPVRFGVSAAQGTMLRPHRALAGCESGCRCEEAGCISTIAVEEVLRAATNRLTQPQPRPTSSQHPLE